MGTYCNKLTGRCDDGCDTQWTGDFCERKYTTIYTNIKHSYILESLNHKYENNEKLSWRTMSLF